MDRREGILVRLVEIAASIEGVLLAGRNLDAVSERNRPAVLIFDADEQVETPATGAGRSAAGASIVAMSPEILLVLGETAAAVGSSMNAIRAALIKAILSDSELLSLCGTNGSIRYEGLATGLSRGRNMEGEMGFAFSFRYPLIVTEL